MQKKKKECSQKLGYSRLRVPFVLVALERLPWGTSRSSEILRPRAVEGKKPNPGLTNNTFRIAETDSRGPVTEPGGLEIELRVMEYMVHWSTKITDYASQPGGPSTRRGRRIYYRSFLQHIILRDTPSEAGPFWLLGTTLEDLGSSRMDSRW